MRRSAFHVAEPHFTHAVHFTNPVGIYFIDVFELRSNTALCLHRFGNLNEACDVGACY